SAAGATRSPQLTPLGEVFAYNNAAIALAGRLIEVVTGSTYEEAVRELVLEPLGMSRSRFFSDESELADSLASSNVAGPHNIVDGEPVLDNSLFDMPRQMRPSGGLFSSVRDLIQYATFHLSDGRAEDGTQLLTNESLVAMRSNPGPGGTLILELDGVGVTWELRPSAEGVPIVEKGGSWPGWYTGFTMVPERGFAIIVLTNSNGGPRLQRDLIMDDWALRRFAGVSNTPAEPRALTDAELAPYEGLYIGRFMDDDGLRPLDADLKADNGQLHMTLLKRPESAAVPGDPEDIAEPEELEPWVEQRLAFYHDDYVLVYDADSGEPKGTRADFIRDADGNLAWLRWGGRLFRHPGATGELPET
ncbi:MAG TPA: serine hydrolase domain-containing protein, partial [Actinomycetota bacterium]|nr:serine hydrolase domain-containing protein [Actinomycetota bacterium]